MNIQDFPQCNFKIEIVEKCAKCGEYHSGPHKKPKWNNAKLVLPDSSRYVLIWVKGTEDNYPKVGWYNEEHIIWSDHSDVLYWRELPKPPKD
jgi:hypothetical protein